MGFLDIFYPSTSRSRQPHYHKSCNCSDCIQRAHSYGELWRHKTPLCTCCDCMAKAGQNIPHNHSTYAHTHANAHTCTAQTGQHYPGITRSINHMQPMPPPRYSLMPETTHKVDVFCPAKAYATPLALAAPHVPHLCCPGGGVSANGQHVCARGPPPPVAHGYNEQMYVSMPGSYRPCNR
ncbi:hypothetical protein LPJ66_007093 [Kickxella alabastrina]|uniref:Uncharacterized protein n=1 Tax=Kickxella alabastrina TaxID=61397 RepID=A0ACC1I9T7_9FUNG|nr:hypothetical protein LPJ66_007093 [Kickxella alabastrina]